MENRDKPCISAVFHAFSTPKNILIRAVRRGKPRENAGELRALLESLQVFPAIVRLLAPELLD